jgi:hypothetical protein
MTEKKKKKTHSGHHATIPFVRAGGQLVNLAHVVNVILPVAGDPKQPLALTLITGTTLQLIGEDAEAVLEALSHCCDVE